MVIYRHIEHPRLSNWDVLMYSKLIQKELVKKTNYNPRYVVLLPRGRRGRRRTWRFFDFQVTIHDV